jgi:hypothetical protein
MTTMMMMMTSFLLMAVLLLAQLPNNGSLVSAQPAAPPDILAGFNTTDEFTATLFSKCGVQIINLTSCMFPGGNFSDTSEAAFLEDCQDCLLTELNTTEAPGTTKEDLSCAAVDAQVEMGFTKCSTQCQVSKCIDTVKPTFQCVFQAIINCTTGEILLSPSPVASPVGGGGATGPGKEQGGLTSTNGNGATSTDGNGPATPAAGSDAIQSSTWFGAATTLVFMVIMMVSN